MRRLHAGPGKGARGEPGQSKADRDRDGRPPCQKRGPIAAPRRPQRHELFEDRLGEIWQRLQGAHAQLAVQSRRQLLKLAALRACEEVASVHRGKL